MAATAKAYKGMSMEGGIARWYDRTTRRDMPEMRALAARIVAETPAGGHVLEVAPGPGFLSIEMAKRGLDVRAIDISKTFVEIAGKNAATDGVRARFKLGNASALPVADASVDFVVCRAAFKNFSEPVKALKEMHRVLRPGGTALVIDMRRDVDPGEIDRYLDGLGVGLLNRIFMRMTFRRMLIPRSYRMEEMRSMIREAGWVNSRLDLTPLGFEAWLHRFDEGEHSSWPR